MSGALSCHMTISMTLVATHSRWIILSLFLWIFTLFKASCISKSYWDLIKSRDSHTSRASWGFNEVWTENWDDCARVCGKGIWKLFRSITTWEALYNVQISLEKISSITYSLNYVWKWERVIVGSSDIPQWNMRSSKWAM